MARFLDSTGRTVLQAFDELIDFIARGSTPQAVMEFVPSEEAKAQIADLIHKEKTSGLTSEESSDVEHLLFLEHVMRLAKARARVICCH